MKKIKNIAIVGADPYNENRGVGALVYSALYLIDKISKKIETNYNIFVIVDGLYKLEDTFIIGDSRIKVKFIKNYNFFSIRGAIKGIMSPKEINKYLKLDYIFDIGAGDSFSDIYGKQRFKTINSSKKVFRLLKKKQILLPQTIGPFEDKEIRKQANHSIVKAAIVFARDKQSYKYVVNNTSQKNIHESIDVAFFMPYKKTIFSNKLINIGISVSALLWHGGYNRNNQFNLKVDYQKLTVSIIKTFLKIDKVHVHLVPHVVGSNRHIENDYQVSKEILIDLNNERVVLAPYFLDPIEAKSYISGLDFFIGARMHACIAAYSSGVPVFPLAYSRKFNGLFVDTLQYDFIGDMVHEEEESILIKLENVFEQREFLMAKIRTTLETVVFERGVFLESKLLEVINA